MLIRQHSSKPQPGGQGLAPMPFRAAQVTDAGMAALCTLRALGALDLSGCVAITERGVGALAGALGRSLRTLKLGGTSRVATINDASLAAVAALTALTHLDLSGSHDVTDAGARAALSPARNTLPRFSCYGVCSSWVCAQGDSSMCGQGR